MKRRTFFAALSALPVLAHPALQSALAAETAIQTRRNPDCSCCENWAERIRASGFTVEITEDEDLAAYRASLGVPADLAGCHTSTVAGYVIEGHVPPGDIAKLLDQRPQIAGIAVPGMPAGSPGMEAGGSRDAFDVIAFTKDGQTSVFSRYAAI